MAGRPAGISTDPTQWRPFLSAALVGAARRDITAPLGIRTANWGAPGRSETAQSVHRPLTATALALADDDGEMLYLVSLDLGWWRNVRDERSVRVPVLAGLGIDESRLLLHLVHTHAGPSTATTDGDRPGAELVADYLATVATTVLEACRAAGQALEPGGITWGIGRCGLATVRDLPCGQTDVVAFNPSVEPDDTLVVGRVHGSAGRTVATLVNYACHPTTLAWQNAALSPDLVGAARDLVEGATGAPMVFLQGASGDLAPRDQYTGDLEVADRNGRSLGYAALSVYESLLPPSTGLRFTGTVESGATLGVWEQVALATPRKVASEVLRVPVPLRALETPEQLLEQWSGLDRTPARERIDRAMALREGYADGDSVRHPVWIVRLGDCVIVAHPGEAYSSLQTELRRRHPDTCIVVMNLTNGPGYVYLPDRPAYERHRYQAWQTLLGPGALEAVVETVDAALCRSAGAAPRDGGAA